jgi:pyruvate dehydrogenase E1 component
MSALIPNCVSYDPTFAHELAVIIQNGMKRMIEDQENVYYYITVMNENYPQPGLTAGDEEGIIRGMYKLKSTDAAKGALRVQLMGSGTILREVLAAQELLQSDWGIGSDLWSVTSFTELRRDGLDCERQRLLHPAGQNVPVPYVTQLLDKTTGPIVVSTDYVKLYGDQIRPYIPSGRRYTVMGTDGFGRSDFRYKLREHFEVDRHFVVLAALRALADDGSLPVAKVAEAIEKYGIDVNKANPHHA